MLDAVSVTFGDLCAPTIDGVVVDGCVSEDGAILNNKSTSFVRKRRGTLHEVNTNIVAGAAQSCNRVLVNDVGGVLTQTTVRPEVA